MKNGQSLGFPAMTRFIVDSRDLELDNPAADPDLMNEIAALTGAVPQKPENFGKFLENLLQQGIQTEITRHARVGLWDNWFFLGLFASLLTIEWYLRKKRGLV